jgi:hypothetical protein
LRRASVFQGHATEHHFTRKSSDLAMGAAIIALQCQLSSV